jgi:hypothetical protein
MAETDGATGERPDISFQSDDLVIPMFPVSQGTDNAVSMNSPITVGIRQSNGRKTLAIVFSAALVVIVVATVLFVVTSGSAVTTALFGGSGTATIRITGGIAPTYEGEIGSQRFAGRANGSGSPYSAQFILSGSVSGTSFSLAASLDTPKYEPGQLPGALTFAVNGKFGSQAVHGTFLWYLPTNLNSEHSSIAVHVKIGSRSLSGTGVMTGVGADVTATLHYMVS